jgi:hypothetical protein
VVGGQANVYLYGITATTWGDMEGFTFHTDMGDFIVEN